MNWLRYNRLPLYQAPDVNSGAVPPVDPAVVAAADPAAGEPPVTTDPPPPVDPVDPPATVDPAAANSQVKPVNNRGKAAPPKWALDRISEESNGKALERDARLKAERERDEALALLNRRDGDAPPAIRQPDDADVETRARQIAADTLNRERIGTVISAGLAKFNDWEDRAATLHAAGAAGPEFVLDVFSVDPANAHIILSNLADDADKAARIAKMDPRARTIELVKMSMAASASTETTPAKSAAPPKTVSKAPAPPPAIDPGSAQAIDWRNDKTSDADFSKGWEENAAKRAARRR